MTPAQVKNIFTDLDECIDAANELRPEVKAAIANRLSASDARAIDKYIGRLFKIIEAQRTIIASELLEDDDG